MEKGPDKPCISRDQARQAFQKSAKNGSIILTKHAREEMKKDEVTTNDLLLLARSGAVINEPEPDIKTGEMTYRIECNSPSQLRAVFIPMDERVRVLTVWLEVRS